MAPEQFRGRTPNGGTSCTATGVNERMETKNNAILIVVIALAILCAIELRVQNRVTRALIVCGIILGAIFGALYAGMEIGRSQAVAADQRRVINMLDAVRCVAEREGIDQAIKTIVALRTKLDDPNSKSESIADIVNSANNTDVWKE